MVHTTFRLVLQLSFIIKKKKNRNSSPIFPSCFGRSGKETHVCSLRVTCVHVEHTWAPALSLQAADGWVQGAKHQGLRIDGLRAEPRLCTGLRGGGTTACDTVRWTPGDTWRAAPLAAQVPSLMTQVQGFFPGLPSSCVRSGTAAAAAAASPGKSPEMRILGPRPDPTGGFGGSAARRFNKPSR